MYLQRILSITSSAPPPIDIRRRSLCILETITSSVYPIPEVKDRMLERGDYFLSNSYVYFRVQVI